MLKRKVEKIQSFSEFCTFYSRCIRSSCPLSTCPYKTSAVRGGGVCPVRIFRGQGGSSDANVRTFWRKNIGFVEIYGVSARDKGVEPVLTFCVQGGGRGNFSRFCVDVFYGQPLANDNFPIG